MSRMFQLFQLKHRFTLWPLVVFSLFAFSALQASAQTCTENAVIEDPPPHTDLRTLCDRLDIFFGDDGELGYGRLYDVLFEKPAGGREAYVAFRKKNADTDRKETFRPFRLTGGYAGSIPQYTIEGCVTVQTDRRVYTYTEIVIGHWVNGDWYFSGFGEPAENKRCHPRKP
mgnify:FL=1